MRVSMTRLLTVAAFLIVTGGCADRPGHTAKAVVLAPSPLPAPGVAMLAITNLVVTRTDPARHDLAISFHLVETSGTIGARITQIRFQLLDAGAARADGVIAFGPFLLANDRVPVGGTILVGGVDPYGSPLIEIGGSFDATCLSIEVAFVDDAGHTGTVGAVADVAHSP